MSSATSWDIVVLDLLAVALIAGTGARPGDICLDQRFCPGRALRYRDIVVYLDSNNSANGQSSSLESLRMVVHLWHTKGNKSPTSSVQLWMQETIVNVPLCFFYHTHSVMASSMERQLKKSSMMLWSAEVGLSVGDF